MFGQSPVQAVEGRSHGRDAPDRHPHRVLERARAGHDGRLAVPPSARGRTRSSGSPASTTSPTGRTAKLSGGQTQRVRFAIALVGDPGLLVLDEPTVALDVEGRRDFWVVMRSVAARGKTVLFATHYLEEADAYSDRIVLMARGTYRRRRPPDRDQVEGRGQDDPGDAPATRASSVSQSSPVWPRPSSRGDSVSLACQSSDSSDRALRELLLRFPTARHRGARCRTRRGVLGADRRRR